MARRDEGLAFVAVLIAIIAIGTAPAAPPDPWDIGAYPFGTLPMDMEDNSMTNECGHIASGSGGNPIYVDDDGDGLANENDPSCIKLIDSDANGVCDTRMFAHMSLESAPDYETDGCTGWE